MTDRTLNIPPLFARRITDALGEPGAAWLRDLPMLIDDLSRHWDVTVGAPFELSFNYVARAKLPERL